jgi:hypothetical protein
MKQQLMLVAMLSVGTALTTMGRIKPVAASLTPPISYDYSYTWNATASEQYLNANGVDSIPLYIRTVNGSHFNYTSTFNVIDGLNLTQSFHRSNTAWQSSGTFYKPDENRIGADSTVGSVEKIFITINNLTNYDYIFWLDLSATGSGNNWYTYNVDGQNYGGTFNSVLMGGTGGLNKFYIPAYANVIFINATTSNALYFDAWYLQNLGFSEAYQQGLDAETDGILTDYLGTDAQQIGWVLIGIAAILFAFKGGK